MKCTAIASLPIPSPSMSANPSRSQLTPGRNDLVGVGRTLPPNQGADIVAGDIAIRN